MTEKKNVPAIRFSEFTDVWKRCKFGELYEKVSRKNDLTYGRDDIISVANMYYKHDSHITENSYLLTYNVFELGDIAFEGNKNKNFAHGRFVENTIGNGIVSHVFDVFKPIMPEYDLLFWKYLINNERVMGSILVRSTKASTMMTNLVANDFLQESILVPSYPEQQKIGAFLDNLDTLISLHQRKYTKLMNIKKSMLEKMFPKNGENVPEVRFAGFTGEWERRKFSDLVDTRRGLTYSPDDVSDFGVRILRSSNIDEDTFVLKEDDVFVSPDAVNIDYAKNGEILITAANGSSRLVGKHALISGIAEDTTVHGGFMLIGSTEYPEFMNASMSSTWYKRFIDVYVAGGNGAIGNLSKSDLDEQIIFVPSDDEKKKIGTFFASLDGLISLHQRRLEKLKNIKSACLEKMIV